MQLNVYGPGPVSNIDSAAATAGFGGGGVGGTDVHPASIKVVRTHRRQVITLAIVSTPQLSGRAIAYMRAATNERCHDIHIARLALYPSRSAPTKVRRANTTCTTTVGYMK